MAKQVVKPSTVWIANSTPPRADQSYQNGNRGSSGNALSGGYTPLTIISPQAVSTTSRFANAYPGLQYNVAIGVVGGYYPYTYELAAAPSGMVIDTDTGVIDWPTAADAGNSYTVSVRVTDNNGSIVTKSWTLNTTTANFYFVDSVNGSSANDGSLASPWKNMSDVFGGGTKFTTYIPDGIIYFRNGTYDFSGVPTEETSPNTRVAWYTDRKATKWLAYPGESPEINFNLNGADIYLSLQFAANDLYFDGLDFNNNNNQRGITIASDPANHWVFRNNNWRGLTNSSAGGNNSHLFYSSGTGQYSHIVGNTNTDSNAGYWMLHYNVSDVLVEDNVISGTSPLPLGLKDDVVRTTIRGNTITSSNVSTGAVWLQEFGHSEGIEICFNKILLPAASDTAVSLLGDAACGAVWVYRNNLVGQAEVTDLTTSKGPWTWVDNVIVNNSAEADKITRTNVTDASRLISTGNLVGVAADNILDGSGNFTTSYLDQIGQKGAQVA